MEAVYNITQMYEGTWRIDEEAVRFFLLEGEKEALLIDSGMMVRNAKEIAASLTKKPVRLLNTHADMDHCGSNAQFEKPFMHPAELANYKKVPGEITPVWDGEILDLGNRPLKIVAMPGHTPGSIAVLDMKNRVLFSGDPIQDGMIFMFGPMREMRSYRYSLERLETLADAFDEICPSHGTCPVGKEMIAGLAQAAQGILEGKYPLEQGEMFGAPVQICHAGGAHFLLDPQ